MADQYYGESELRTWNAQQHAASLARDNEKMRVELISARAKRDGLTTALEDMLKLFGRPHPGEYIDGGTTYKLAVQTIEAARSALAKAEEP